jgi:hypothetical protein
MSQPDETRELLEKVLSDLYKKQSAQPPLARSYLQGQDGQFLGEISSNRYSSDSILNQYGPYGSQYSSTSIFNQYSPYGSPYGQFSINNPYSTTPPKLFINGQFKGHVSKNQYVPNQIPTEGFLYTLEHDVEALQRGELIQNETEARKIAGDSFIVAEDGTFLGSLKPNRYDEDSIFNRYGPYGSRYSATSIFNRYGTYGGRYSALSPFNPYTTTPPKVFRKREFAGYLTTNKSLHPRIEPDLIMDWAVSHVSKY